MNELILALQIFAKYTDTRFPTHCEHDILLIADVEKEQVTYQDIIELEGLGFQWNEEYDSYASYRFGSA